MKLEIFDDKGKKLEDFALQKEIFGVEVNSSLLTQYVHVYRTNQRQGTVSSKTRGEVSGGGKKPWRQKGTGRARHGSTRSPLWVHGGASHGPKPRLWSLSMPKKMKRLAMLSALSFKYLNGAIKGLNSLTVEKPNTKYINDLLNNLSLSGKTLFVLAKGDKNVLKSVENIKNARLADIGNLNVYDVLNAKNVVFEKEAISSLQKKFK